MHLRISFERLRPALPAGQRRTAAGMLLLVFALGSASPSEHDRALSAAVGNHRFDLVRWEAQHLAERVGRVGHELLVQSDSPQAAVRAYFGASAPAARAALRTGLEIAIDQEIAFEAAAEGLTVALPFSGPIVWPPPSTWVGPPPQVLILSPRNRIEVRDSILLDPDVPLEAALRAESRLDAQGHSALVVPIGGLSTYPSMVLDLAWPSAVLNAAAHEWLHGYLFFHPLGQAYFSDYDARAINETVADLAGREIGGRILLRVGPVAPPPERTAIRHQLDFNRHMRETRRQVDRLLTDGLVGDAERYMEQRRLELEADGYGVRKLNQAYFAFHGSYTDGPAASSVSPIPDQVKRLRAQSSSLGDFLRRAALLRNADDLARAVGDN